jgi:hypothetical protein
MIRKSKLGAITFIAAIGLASPGFAQMQAGAIGKGPVADLSSLHAVTLVACYTAACNGGGSVGYNHQVATDYRLKHHNAHVRNHSQ